MSRDLEIAEKIYCELRFTPLESSKPRNKRPKFTLKLKYRCYFKCCIPLQNADRCSVEYIVRFQASARSAISSYSVAQHVDGVQPPVPMLHSPEYLISYLFWLVVLYSSLRRIYQLEMLGCTFTPGLSGHVPTCLHRLVSLSIVDTVQGPRYTS